MDELDNKIKNILSKDIETSYKYHNMIRNTLKEKRNKRNIYFEKGIKLVTVSCVCVVVTTSIVFAKDISSWFKGRFNNKSEGIDIAIDNGYILEPNMEYIKCNDTEVKIDNLIMDNLNLSFTMNLKLNAEIEVNEITKISLPDMLIIDNYDKILYCQDKDTFDKYCQDNRIDLKYKEFNENNINSGSNWFIKGRNLQDNTIDIVYNLYANEFPKSRKLNFVFKNIKIEVDNCKKIIEGDWKLNLEIPEEFYNREALVYKVKKCSDPGINITEALVYNTSMRFSLTTQEKIVYDKNDSMEVINEKIRESLNKKNKEMIEKVNKGDLESFKLFSDITYVETENGEKYYPTKNSSEDSGYKEDYMTGLVTYWQTCNLTKYNASSKLKIYLKYQGEEIWVELEI